MQLTCTLFFLHDWKQNSSLFTSTVAAYLALPALSFHCFLCVQRARKFCVCVCLNNLCRSNRSFTQNLSSLRWPACAGESSWCTVDGSFNPEAQTRADQPSVDLRCCIKTCGYMRFGSHPVVQIKYIFKIYAKSWVLVSLYFRNFFFLYWHIKKKKYMYNSFIALSYQ